MTSTLMMRNDGERRTHAVVHRPSIESITNEFVQLSVKDSRSLDRHFAREILQTSTQDRTAITEEIHGVATMAPEESPESLERGLLALSHALCAIPNRDPRKAAYAEAQVLPESYVNTPEFRLRFLRHEMFDAEKAAQRMLTFLDLASSIFGPQVLERPIRLEDFTAEDFEFWNLGIVQILPYRDQTGRPILLWMGDVHHLLRRKKSFHKVVLYLSYIMSNDVENQRKGFVKVYLNTFADDEYQGDFNYPKFNHDFDFKDLVRNNRKYHAANPMRTSAFHVCVPSTPFFRVFSAGVRLVLRGNLSQTRLRFHCGEDLEMKYVLKTYGIPVELIPGRRGPVFCTKFMKQWLTSQKLVEEAATTANPGSIILYPGSDDVLYRMGSRTLTCHPGNTQFQGLIESRMPEHSRATQTGKKAITTALIETVQRQGGRFLRWNRQGYWEEITEASQIHTKVANQVKQYKFKPLAAGSGGKPTTTQTVRSSTSLFRNQDHAQATKRRKTSHNTHSDSGSDSEASCACFF